MAECFIRGFPFDAMCFKYIDDTHTHMDKFRYTDEDADEDGLVKCDAIGTPCTIMNMKLFKLIPKPWFLTGEFHSEDVYFCMKADKYVENLGIYVDTTIECGHLYDMAIINRATKEIMKKHWRDTPGQEDGLWRIFPLAARPKEEKEEPRPNPFIQDEEMENAAADS